MDKILNLLKKLGIELTADQTAQVKEVLGREFVAAEDAAKRTPSWRSLESSLNRGTPTLKSSRQKLPPRATPLPPS